MIPKLTKKSRAAVVLQTPQGRVITWLLSPLLVGFLVKMNPLSATRIIFSSNYEEKMKTWENGSIGTEFPREGEDWSSNPQNLKKPGEIAWIWNPRARMMIQKAKTGLQRSLSPVQESLDNKRQALSQSRCKMGINTWPPLGRSNSLTWECTHRYTHKGKQGAVETADSI